MNDKVTHISESELEEMKLRFSKTTKSPWVSYVEGRDHTSGSDFIMTGNTEDRGNDIELSGATVADQDFIAHARQDIPRLLNEIKLLKGLLNNNT